jgi:predicted RNA-binding Zn-ribbon protein involved in translation (DUF1610 family)
MVNKRWLCPDCGENFIIGAPIEMIETVTAYRRGRVINVDESDDIVVGEMVWEDNIWPPFRIERIAARYECGNCGEGLEEEFVIEVMKEREREDEML